VRPRIIPLTKEITMQGKIMFVLGAATGYVFGTRTGRQGYERLKRQARDFWQNPRVQSTVSSAGDLAREKIPVVGEKVSDAARKATGAASDAAAKHSASESSTTSESTPDSSPSQGSVGNV
jgi:hypothetical protein